MKSLHRVKILRVLLFLSSAGQYLVFCTGAAFHVQNHLQPIRLLYIYTFFSILSTRMALVSLEKGQSHQDSEACTVAGSRYIALPPAQIPLIIVPHRVYQCSRLALIAALPAIDLDDAVHTYATKCYTPSSFLLFFPFNYVVWRRVILVPLGSCWLISTGNAVPH